MRTKQRHRKSFKSILVANNPLLDILKNIVEIIALLIAAAWALYNFEIKDTPSLENAAASDCSLQLDSLSNDKNFAIFLVHLKNNGRTSFDVDSMQIKYWMIPFSRLTQANYFSATEYMKRNKPTFQLTDYSFSFHYTPEKECADRFNFLVDERKDYSLLISATFFIQGSRGVFGHEKFQDDTYTFRLHCQRNALF